MPSALNPYLPKRVEQLPGSPLTREQQEQF